MRTNKIQQLKEELYSTDRLVLEYIEGVDMSAYGDWKGRRAEIRAEINRLSAMTDEEYTAEVEGKEESTTIPTADAKKYKSWYDCINKPLEVGEKVTYIGAVYEVIQAHTVQATWSPSDAVSLFKYVGTIGNTAEDTEEAPTTPDTGAGEEGTESNPIAWTSGMTAEEGKYYSEDGIVYLCTRGSGSPLYFRIADLAEGLYFERVTD